MNEYLADEYKDTVDEIQNADTEVRASKELDKALKPLSEKDKPMVQLDPDSTREVTLDGKKIMLPYTLYQKYGCINGCEWKGTAECPFGYKRGVLVKNLKESKEIGKPVNVHTNKLKITGTNTHICRKRINWLKQFSPNGRPTEALWQRSFDMWMAHRIKNEDGGRLLRLMDQRVHYQTDFDRIFSDFTPDTHTGLADFKQQQLSENPKANVDGLKQTDVCACQRCNMQSKIEAIEKRIAKTKADYMFVWQETMKYEDKQIERETPKKVEMDIRKVPSMQDIQSAVRQYEKGEAKDADYEVIDED